MWNTPFIIAAWLTVSFFPQQSDTHSVVLVEFSRPLIETSLLRPENYSLENLTYNHSVGIDSVFQIFVLEEDTVKLGCLVALVTQRLEIKSEYLLRTFNLTDTSGAPLTVDSDWFYFNGYADNLFETPSPSFSNAQH